jgi:hypothetical protein
VRDALTGVAADANRLRAEFLARSRAAAAAPIAPDLERRRKTSVVGGTLLHIVDSPEILYACLEEGNVFGATAQFVASEKAYAELDNRIAPNFAQSRWALVDAFRPQILAAAKERTSDRSLGPDDCAGAVASVLLLSSERNAYDTISGFLAVRTAWIDALLNFGPADRESIDLRSAAARMGALASIVCDVVVGYVGLFLGENANLALKLRSIEPSLANSVQSANGGGTVSRLIVDWVKGVATAIAHVGVRIADEACSARDLADTLSAVHRVFESDKWKDACSQVLNLDPGIGPQMFLPLISVRSKKVAELSVLRAVESTVEKIDLLYKNISMSSNCRAAVWSAIAMEAVGSDYVNSPSQNALAVEHAATGPAGHVIGDLERAICEALRDASCLVESLPEVGVSMRAAVYAHMPTIASFLREKADALTKEQCASSLGHVDRHRENISIQTNVGCPATDDDIFLEKALFIARVASALPTAKGIGSAFAQGFAVETNENESNKSCVEMQEFHETAIEASICAYKAWAGCLCIVFGSKLRKELRATAGLELQAGWGAMVPKDGSALVKGEGRTSRDTGDLQQFPSNPSPAAMRYVLAGCTAANHAGGFAVPTRACFVLSAAMRREFVRSYEGAFESYRIRADEGNLGHQTEKNGRPRRALRRENVYLQLLFDIIYLSILLLGSGAENFGGTGPPDFIGSEQGYQPSRGRSSKEDADSEEDKSRLNALCTAIRSKIDPINLATVGRSLEESARNSVFRSSVLLGAVTIAIIPVPDHAKFSQSGVFQSANLSAIAAPVGRFPYLPAPMPSTYTGRSGLAAGLNARAAADALSKEAASKQRISESKRREESTVVDYASKITENVGRFGKGLFESWRGVGQ